MTEAFNFSRLPPLRSRGGLQELLRPSVWMSCRDSTSNGKQCWSDKFDATGKCAEYCLDTIANKLARLEQMVAQNMDRTVSVSNEHSSCELKVEGRHGHRPKRLRTTNLHGAPVSSWSSVSSTTSQATKSGDQTPEVGGYTEFQTSSKPLSRLLEREVGTGDIVGSSRPAAVDRLGNLRSPRPIRRPDRVRWRWNHRKGCPVETALLFRKTLPTLSANTVALSLPFHRLDPQFEHEETDDLQVQDADLTSPDGGRWTLDRNDRELRLLFHIPDWVRNAAQPDSQQTR